MGSMRFRRFASCRWAALLLGTVAPFACGDGQPGAGGPAGGEELRSTQQRVLTPQVPDVDFTAQVQGNTAFALDVYQQVRGKPGNLFFSPHSISVALAMLQAGAAGSTAQELAQVLHFVLPQSALHPALNKLDLALASRGQGKKAADGKAFRLNVVNAIWGQKGFGFLPTYLDTLALNYGAGLNLLDFATQPEPSRLVINDWVEQKTEKRIVELIPAGALSTDTRMVLTNAVYFNAAWAKAFDEKDTVSAPFTLADGSKVNVPTMTGSIPGSYLQGQGFQAAALPYDGGELSMLIVLPDAGTFDAFEAGLTGATLDDIACKLAPLSLQATLPKFEVKADLAAGKVLKDLGATTVFLPGAADLSGIDGQRDLFVSDVLHKAFVKVNEAGTEAAAATAVIVEATGLPQNVPFVVDRPFILAIRDHQTGAVLFVGRVVDPR